MAKRASASYYILAVIISVLFIILPTYFAIGAVITQYSDLISTYELENRMLIQRITYSPNSFFYKDKITGRTYQNIIDLERFSEDRIINLLGNLDEDVGVYIVLNYNNIKREIFVNKDYYLSALSKEEIFDFVTINRIVRVIDKSDSYLGNLSISISFKKND